MEKAGWQVVAGLSATIAVIAVFAAYANGRAAEQATEDLKEARAAASDRVITVEKYHQLPCAQPADPDYGIGMKPYPPGAECRGGVLLQRNKSGGWESITNNGRAIACRE